MEIAGLNEDISLRRVQGIIKSVPDYYPAFTPHDFEGIEPWYGLRPCSPMAFLPGPDRDHGEPHRSLRTCNDGPESWTITGGSSRRSFLARSLPSTCTSRSRPIPMIALR